MLSESVCIKLRYMMLSTGPSLHTNGDPNNAILLVDTAGTLPVCCPHVASTDSPKGPVSNFASC